MVIHLTQVHFDSIQMYYYQHILYPNIDPDHVATQSEILMKDLLRGEMGFEGLIVADDFRMNGLRSRTSLEQAAVRFILAGGDLVLCGANHDYQRAILKKPSVV